MNVWNMKKWTILWTHFLVRSFLVTLTLIHRILVCIHHLPLYLPTPPRWSPSLEKPHHLYILARYALIHLHWTALRSHLGCCTCLSLSHHPLLHLSHALQATNCTRLALHRFWAKYRGVLIVTSRPSLPFHHQDILEPR